MQRDVAGLVAFAVYAQVRDAAAGVYVFDLQATEFFGESRDIGGWRVGRFREGLLGFCRWADS
jgi:hypothetical protein